VSAPLLRSRLRRLLGFRIASVLLVMIGVVALAPGRGEPLPGDT
jgi:hypothetical protein